MEETLQTRIFRRIPGPLKPPVRVLRIATAKGGMPWRARFELIRAAYLVCRKNAPDVTVHLPGGAVCLGGESLYVDAMTLGYVWGERVFAPDCRGRIVVDLGAHKGYFAAWALAREAFHVHSIEPQTGNFARLDRARQINSRCASWSVERSAVGTSTGTVTLFVSSESWAHSVHEGMVQAVALEEVEMVTLGAVLRRVGKRDPDREVVLKVNVEGSVGSALLPTSSEDLRRVVEVHLDHEPGSPYDLESVLNHLAAAGLDQVTSARDKIFVIRRSHSLQRRDGVSVGAS